MAVENVSLSIPVAAAGQPIVQAAEQPLFDIKNDPLYQKIDGIVSEWETRIKTELRDLSHALANPKIGLKREIRRHLKNMSVLTSKDLLTEFERKARCELDGNTVSDADFKRRMEEYTPVFLRVIKSQQDICAKQVEDAKATIKDIDQDPQGLEKLWYSYGFDGKILIWYEAFAKFLKESDMLFAMRGYQCSCPHDLNLSKVIQFDPGHPEIPPEILMNGQWTSWTEIEQQLVFNEELGEIVSRDDPSKIWNYLYPDGLVCQDRFDSIFSVLDLSEEDYDAIKMQGMKFFETNPEIDPGEDKTCFVQFFSTVRKSGLPDWQIFNNLRYHTPAHIGVRIVVGRKLYSIGYELNKPTASQVSGKGLPWTLAKSAEVHITSRDYEEFRPFTSRRTTTVPITDKRAQNILAYLEKLAKDKTRFNYLRQNCTRFAVQMAKMCGCNVNCNINVWELIGILLPDLKDIPYIGWLLDKIASAVRTAWNFVVSITPFWIETPIKWVVMVLTFVPRKILTLIESIVGLILGTARSAGPIPVGVDENLDNSEELTQFTCLWSNWTDCFNDDAWKICYPGLFYRWQDLHNSTSMDDYRGPQFYIVPNKGEPLNIATQKSVPRKEGGKAAVHPSPRKKQQAHGA